MCGHRKQSPINIVTNQVLQDHRLTSVQFKGYQETFRSVILNNGHAGIFTYMLANVILFHYNK